MQDFNREISITRFFICIAIILIAAPLILLSFVIFIDPYNISRDRSHARFNAMKLEIPSSAQIGTAILSSALYQPDILILGSSRVRRGFNEVFASQLYGAKVQVTGINTLHLSTAKNIFRSVSKKTQLKKIYIEVNYFMANDCGKADDPAFDSDYLVKLFSYFPPKNSILFSMKTLRINILGPRAVDSYYDKQGRFHDLPSKVASLADAESYKSYQNNFFQNMTKNCRRNPENQADIAELTEIFKLAQSSHTEVVLLILPASPRALARVRQAEFTPTVDHWKKNVARLARQFQATLIDYEDRNDFPEPGETAANKMPLFWDENHFSNRIGDRLLGEMRTSGRAQ
ncbi:hypothetical protein [Janthinobacterium sp.]|uniref:hypothetical protein n=1 Tax=Janthinobacterium sp. TaxID=1871054 RepID=UPI002588C6C9|nr:hypothetical protein [Janthinobacterium sp.]MCX7292210.1 hypothetical protein [Janthinobacterium sp.]